MINRRDIVLAGLSVPFLVLTACASEMPAPPDPPTSPPLGHGRDYLPLSVFYDLLADEAKASASIARIEAGWRDAYAPLLLDLIYFSVSPGIDAEMTRLLERAAGVRVDRDYDPVYRWLWSFDPGQHPDFAEFRAELYARIDPRFRQYFDGDPPTRIRLDEIRWGGVRQDGIPPLVNPGMIRAPEASYLGGDDVVFGVSIDGDARAYPKRILAWHEMVKDTVGGRALTGVYCTLCGAMILYDTDVGGVRHELGTSGFLYRSNKLMYDHATQSLWSTFTGEPVLGPLVGKGIELETLHVVTTTWKEWRARHPDTLVLSLDTGHERDYSEGAAYRDYFGTDRLMFAVPKLDRRLPNKAEVLALRYGDEPLAISARFLARNPVYHDRAGGTDFVVLTDPSGANRVYEAPGVRFGRWDGGPRILDEAGRGWTVTESALSTEGRPALGRLAAHRAFWFGWYSQFPHTRLVK